MLQRVRLRHRKVACLVRAGVWRRPAGPHPPRAAHSASFLPLGLRARRSPSRAPPPCPALPGTWRITMSFSSLWGSKPFSKTRWMAKVCLVGSRCLRSCAPSTATTDRKFLQQGRGRR